MSPIHTSKSQSFIMEISPRRCLSLHCCHLCRGLTSPASTLRKMLSNALLHHPCGHLQVLHRSDAILPVTGNAVLSALPSYLVALAPDLAASFNTSGPVSRHGPRGIAAASTAALAEYALGQAVNSFSAFYKSTLLSYNKVMLCTSQDYDLISQRNSMIWLLSLSVEILSSIGWKSAFFKCSISEQRIA